MKEEFIEWLNTLQPWLINIIDNGYDLESKEAIDVGVNLCIEQYKDDINISKRVRKNNSEISRKIILKRIFGITNLFNLKNDSEIVFEDGMNLIYGQNGSGKTSLVKLLQYANDNKAKILSNIYKDLTNGMNYKIEYLDNSNMQTFEYLKTQKLIDIDIFNEELGDRLITNDKEINIESEELIFLQKLAMYCDNVKAELKKKIDLLSKEKKQLLLPQGLVCAENENKIQTINNANLTNLKEIVNSLFWTKENEESLNKIISNLDSDNFNLKVNELNDKIARINLVINDIDNIINTFNNEEIIKLNELKKKYIEDSISSKEYSKNIFNQSVIGEIGSTTWKKMWHAAREYSSIVYKDKEFPNVGDNAVCVLCHQPLNNEAKNRMLKFEEYIKSSIETELMTDEKLIKDNKLLNYIIPKDLIVNNSKEIYKNNYEKECKKVILEIDSVINWQKEMSEKIDCFRNIEISELKKYSTSLQEKLKMLKEEHEKLISDETRLKINEKRIVLEGEKWIASQKNLLNANINLIEEATIFSNALSLTSTNRITNKSKELSESLLTENYEKDFNDALAYLGAEKLHVSLVTGKAAKGKGSLRIVLQDQNGNPVNTKDILSTGECRVVSLAAFIADGKNRSNNIPFVFDDPISSLDFEYEGKVAKALNLISKDRQVIIFTHRLSLASVLCHFENIKLFEITSDSIKGCGNIDYEPALILNKPNAITKGLNNLKVKINELIKKYNNDEISNLEYKASIDGYISKFRKFIESTIEVVLIADIVQRFRVSVMSTKVKELEKIEKEECELIDKLMTKYSINEHSQSTETDEIVPEYSELIKDIECLIDMINNHNKK